MHFLYSLFEYASEISGHIHISYKTQLYHYQKSNPFNHGLSDAIKSKTLSYKNINYKS